ncbi:unnamed protein product [Tuber aestivum]|uniref:Small RNA 2'-O-methyltransferase n=1 Tax=Tuber aestivum TaxID=59557 RepID=A0A292Q703_9PEZI|nr:unnamed protein product [Tuber aestivum]
MEQEATARKSPTLSPTVGPLPHIVFSPQQYLQRRFAIHSILRKLSTQQHIIGGLQSLLDVGCGSDILLLLSLIPCEDALPIEVLTGIDISDDIKSDLCIESISPGAWTGNTSGEDRWRPLDIVLLYGDFQYLSPYLIPKHDIIVSSEVIEHLDPKPLSLYAGTLLGTMRPKVCIITTPNRDFNPIFSINFPSQGQNEIEFLDSDKPNNSGKFWREGVSYFMRHHDHRFEWTRAEFRTWARNAGQQFGYKVDFTGVGSFGYSMMIENVDEAVVEEYLTKDMSGRVDKPEDADYFELEPARSNLAKRAGRVYGDCTQIAVFTINTDNSNMDCQELCEGVSLKHALKVLPPVGTTTDGIYLAKHVEYPWVDYPYPPGNRDTLVMIQGCLNQFIPTLVYDAWSNPPVAEWDKPRETDIMELGFDDEDPIAKRKRTYDELRNARDHTTRLLQGKNPADLEVLVVPVELKRIWDSDWKLQRAFRFDYHMFTTNFHLGGAPNSNLNDTMSLSTEWDEIVFAGAPHDGDYTVYVSTQGFQIKYGNPQNPVFEPEPDSFPFSDSAEGQPNIWAEFAFTPGIVPKTHDEDERVVLILGKNATVLVAPGDDEDMCGKDILWVTFRKGVVFPPYDDRRFKAHDVGGSLR